MKKIFLSITVLFYGVINYAMDNPEMQFSGPTPATKDGHQTLSELLQSGGYKNWGEHVAVNDALKKDESYARKISCLRWLSCNCCDTQDGPTVLSRVVQGFSIVGISGMCISPLFRSFPQLNSFPWGREEIVSLAMFLEVLAGALEISGASECQYEELKKSRDEWRKTAVEELLKKKKNE